MKNNIYILILLIFFKTYSSLVYAGEQFNFDVTEIEIFEKGNKFKGTKRGKITSDNGVVLDADTFEYDKATNIHKKYSVTIDLRFTRNSFIPAFFPTCGNSSL